MAVTVFSSTGCIRCAIVKRYLLESGAVVIEHDIKTPAGNEAFKAFYRTRRSEIRRDAEGIFFPVVMDEGGHITQDAGCTLAWFLAGGDLGGMVAPNNLGHGWTGGLFVSKGEEEHFASFLAVLRLLKQGGLQTEATADGGHGVLLRAALAENLVDRLIFHVVCPPPESGNARSDLETSLRAIKAAPGGAEARFLLDIGGGGGPVSPASAAESAKLLQEAAGDNRLPLLLTNTSGEPVNLFQYRTEVRRWQVLADIAPQCKSPA